MVDKKIKAFREFIRFEPLTVHNTREFAILVATILVVSWCLFWAIIGPLAWVIK